MVEHVDRRVLGAVRFIDRSTGSPVTAPLRIESDGIRWVQNQRGDHVILDAPGLHHHTLEFDSPPDTPNLNSLTVTAQVDPSRGNGAYLPRRFTLPLPRDPDANAQASTQWLFRPTEVALFPSPTAPTAPIWAVIRASVFRQNATDFSPASRDRLPGTLIRVVRNNESQPFAWGMSDHRGEALVPVPGVRLTNFSDSADADAPALSSQIDVTIESFYDPTNQPDSDEYPDPDELEARRDQLQSGSINASLAAGQTLTLNLFVNAA